MGFELYDEVNYFSQAKGKAKQLHAAIALRCDDKTRRTKYPISTGQLLRESQQHPDGSSHLSEQLKELRDLDHVTSDKTGTDWGMRNFYCHPLAKSSDPGGTFGGINIPSTSDNKVPSTSEVVPSRSEVVPSTSPFIQDKTKRRGKSASSLHPTGKGKAIKKEGVGEVLPSNPEEKAGADSSERKEPSLNGSREWWRNLAEAEWLAESKVRYSYIEDLDVQLARLMTRCKGNRHHIVNCLNKVPKPEPVTLETARLAFDNACIGHSEYWASMTRTLQREFATAEAAHDLPACLVQLKQSLAERMKRGCV